MEYLSSPQFWIILAAVALLLELFSLAFFAMFLSFGALVTAGLAWIGLLPGLPAQLLCFGGSSLLSLVVFRKYAQQYFGNNEKSGSYREFIGDPVQITVAIPANGEGKASYRGSEWIAVGVQGAALEAGTTAHIKQVDGIKLVVQ